MNTTFSFGRKEKLKSRKQFSQLFESKQAFLVFPLKVFYMLPKQPLDNTIKTGVGVNSRNFKKAVDRNRIKRLLREGYRLNKLALHQYLETHQKQAIVFFLYIDKTPPETSIIQRKMPVAIHELIKRLDEQIAQNT